MGAPVRHEVGAGPHVGPASGGAFERPVDALGAYLRRVGVHALLDAAGERRLAQEIEAAGAAEAALARPHPPECAGALRKRVERGRAARRTFIEANLRLVVAVAKRYATAQFPLADCIQEGNLGLLKAVDRFDWRRGCRFSTHATWWIRQAITSALTQKARTVRVPTHVAQKLHRLGRARDELASSLGRAASNEELAAACGLTEEEVSELLAMMRGPVSIHQSVGDNGAQLGDFIEDADSEDPVEAVAQHLRDEALGAALAALDGPERAVISLRYGLDTGVPRTLADVGARLRLTKTHVRRVESEAIAKLRESPCARRLGPA
jgi:RNA polymerase sigma factor (sigma-70 family)